MLNEPDDEDIETEDLNDMAEWGVSLQEEDAWEDSLAILDIRKKYPYPHIIKVTNYTATKLKEMEEWCGDNCTAKWERIGWSSNCAYTVAIGFANPHDAIIYRLRWQ